MQRPHISGRTERALALGVLVLIGAGGTATYTRLQTPPDIGDRPSSFGMIGLARAQTARLNVVDIRAIAPDVGDVPDPCRIELRFLDSRGGVLRTSHASLALGHAAFLDLVRDAAPAPSQPSQPPDGPDRQQIRAVWVAPDIGDAPQCGQSNFIATVEVFGQDGKTSVLYQYQPPDVGDAPQR